ncbi:hypothetical protein BD408DRAFT_408275 [Parasitella parasitica]|nr:hypothetical protein BD408DRAFT_408275 [Parasitella parasitica]
MLRFAQIPRLHKTKHVRLVASKAIERPHSHAFYDDKIASFAGKQVNPVTLGKLAGFGRPPLSNESLQACTQYARTELPVRLARRFVLRFLRITGKLRSSRRPQRRH